MRLGSPLKVIGGSRSKNESWLFYLKGSILSENDKNLVYVCKICPNKDFKPYPLPPKNEGGGGQTLNCDFWYFTFLNRSQERNGLET